MAYRRILFLDALRCGTEAAAQRCAERQANAWVTAHQLRKAVLIEAKQLAIAVGQHSRRAWLAGEERHLSKTCATPQRGDTNLTRVMFAADENAECALGDEVKAVAHLALPAGRAVFDEADGIEIGRQLGQGHPIDAREQIGLRQKFPPP